MNMESTQVFFMLLAAGLLLFGAEVFVPGGILGFIGAVALVAACVAGFYAFPGYGVLVTLGIVALAGLVLALWIKYFPRSPLGRKMTVERNLSDAKATEDGLDALVGKTGEALSDLRPGGFVRIDGRRVDVVTQGGMIEPGARVVVVEVQGNRVVVRRADVG
jgi:membrane-bound serine protease (ClpP class)